MSIKITAVRAQKEPAAPWAGDQGCQGLPGVAGQGRHLPGDGDSLGHQPVGGGQDPGPGIPLPGTRMATALRELELRRGPNSRGCELALNPPAQALGGGML